MNTLIKKAWILTGTFVLVFFLSSVVLFFIDFVPEAPDVPEFLGSEDVSIEAEFMAPEEPVRIKIPTIGVDTPIGNPTSSDAKVLDTALLSGAVRYPASAVLGEVGTVYLFGHQSYLPVVKNKAFKAFNDLQKLEVGDLITVASSEAEYQYRVSSVTLVEASDGIIPLVSETRKLILSTCNSFSSDHEQRYVVEAEFVARTPRS